MTTPNAEEPDSNAAETDDSTSAEGGAEESVGAQVSAALEAYTKRQRQELAQSYTTSTARLMASAYLPNNDLETRIAAMFGYQRDSLKETFAGYLNSKAPIKETFAAYVDARTPIKATFARAYGVPNEAIKASLASVNEPVTHSLNRLIAQAVVANRPVFVDFESGLKTKLGRFLEQADSQAVAREHMVRLLDQSLPKVALGVDIADAAGPAMRLLGAYDGWLTSYQPATWTTEAVAKATSRGFTVDGLIATDSLTTLEPETAGYTDLADLVEAEVLPPWQEARLDLALGFEARLKAIDPKMAELYRAACAAAGRVGQDGYLEEACTGIYELLVRLVRDHLAPDKKMEAYEKTNPSVKLRNPQGKFTYAGRVRYVTLGHSKGSDRDLFSATVENLTKKYDALISKSSKGRHYSVGDAMSLRTMLMATESTLSQVLDFYESQQDNPPQG